VCTSGYGKGELVFRDRVINAMMQEIMRREFVEGITIAASTMRKINGDE